jgi:hypothetical protein
MLKKIRLWFRTLRYREGATLSSFVACDVRRDVVIVSAARIRDGVITVRTRTINLLYVSNGLVPPPEFDEPTEIRIEELWNWSGASFGGLPDGTSITDRYRPQFFAPWESLEPDNNLHEELQREAPPEHVLYGAETRAIAHRRDCDDFLFYVLNREFTFAVVHLTWHKETDATWPSTELFIDWNAFKTERHDPEVADWTENLTMSTKNDRSAR